MKQENSPGLKIHLDSPGFITIDWMVCECGSCVHTAYGGKNVLHKCLGAWQSLNIEALGTSSVQKLKEPIHPRQLPAWCNTLQFMQ